MIVTDVHLGARAAPAFLKTLEEPPGATVFILLADDVTPELATVASRCVEIAFPPVPRAAMVQWLRAAGMAAEMAAVVADSSGGNPGAGPGHDRRSRGGGAGLLCGRRCPIS